MLKQVSESKQKPQNNALEYIDSTHTYLYNGVIIPSVTQIISIFIHLLGITM